MSFLIRLSKQTTKIYMYRATSVQKLLSQFKSVSMLYATAIDILPMKFPLDS